MTINNNNYIFYDNLINKPIIINFKKLYNFLKIGFNNSKQNPTLILITFLNIGFFMSVQIIFFYFIASKQLDTIIKSKVDILKNFITYDTTESTYLKKEIKEYTSNNDFKKKLHASQQTKNKRMEINKLILFQKLKYFLIPILIIIILLTIYIIYSNNKNDKSLSVSNKILIFFVLFAFTTELIFYFTIVNNYQFTGDIEILNILYKSIASNFNNNSN